MIDENILKKCEYLINSFYNFINVDKYIGIKDYEKFIKKYNELLNELNKITIQNETIIKVKRIFNDRETILKKHNTSFLNRKLVEEKEYFDNMFINIDKNIKLDDNQRRAIITDEDNLLIVAGAGSGKTTTMAAKVKYLVEKQKINPKEIAVISFTNKAADEIENRIHNDFGIKDVDVYTFHKLGMKIIRNSGKEIVSIIDDGGKYKIFSNYIKNVVFNDKNFFEEFNNAFNDKIYFDEEYKKFNSFKEYHDYSYNQKMIDNKFNIENYIKSETSKRKNYLKTINGEYTKSKQEVEIANFLFLNNIQYEYEKIYDKKIGDRKSYKPDFYIRQLDKHNYIEHFGVSEKYQNTKYTEKELETYLKNMKLKIEFHNSLDKLNNFITTYSSYNDDKSVIYHLKEELLKHDYQLSRIENEVVFKRLRDTSEDTYFGKFIDRILIPFISIFKQYGYNKNSFKELKEKVNENLKEKLNILENFYIYYEEELKRQNRVDFEDMINLSYNIIPTIKEENLGIDYNYIIIDEYQDISFQRYNLTKRISDLFDAKIMAVGDDFQAIFGFAGSSIDLFVDFEKNLEGAQTIPIINTYRNSQELVDVASDFVLKNKYQLKKYLNSNKHLQKPVEIVLYDDQKFGLSEYTKPLAVSKIIEKIYAEDPKKTILIMGRYKDDIKTLINSDLFSKINHQQIICKTTPNAKIDFLTVHSAKGLGYDECILINCSNEKFGFPSLIEDEPIISILKPKYDEEIPYPEERRLFYVALTRTKNKLYITAPSTHESSFIEEIKNHKNVLYYKSVITCDEKIKTKYLCPNCKNYLSIFNYKNTNYWLYECCECNFRTNTPKKCIPIEICPKCGEIVVYKYTCNDKYILKCFNKKCDFSKSIKKY